MLFPSNETAETSVGKGSYEKRIYTQKLPAGLFRRACFERRRAFLQLCGQIYILEITQNNAFLQGLYLAVCGAVNLLFTPVGGVLGDRFHKGKIMFVCDYLKGGVILLATLAMVLMAGLREKMEYNDIPKSFRGMPMVLLTAMLMSLAFFGFSGII